MQLSLWQQDAPTRALSLSVNVSAKQFHQADFVSQLRAVLQQHAIDPALLTLELTESVLLENIEDTIAKMHALKEIGVRFSLDDFGTGYSSLQYLKRLPLDQFKIDQSFVRDIAVDGSDQAIVRTIIAMALTLNLDVIAEGVETDEQKQISDRGCTHFQGYLFGKPVLIETFEAKLEASLNSKSEVIPRPCLSTPASPHASIFLIAISRFDASDLSARPSHRCAPPCRRPSPPPGRPGPAPS